MDEAKNNIDIDRKNVVEQKETNKEPTKTLSQEEIETLKKSTQLIEDFGRYLGDEDLGKKWRKTLEQGTNEEISAEYQKLDAFAETFKQFLQERLKAQDQELEMAREIAKQNGEKAAKQRFYELDEYFDKPLSKTNNAQPAITLENAFGVKGPGLGG